MEPPYDLVVDREVENEMLLSLNLLNMIELENHVWSVNMVVSLYPHSMEAYPKLDKRDAKGLNPLTEGVLQLNNEFIS